MTFLYRDRRLVEPVEEDELYENNTYYLDVEAIPDSTDVIFKSSALANHLSWVPSNRIAELKITNHIGTICISNVEFDVKSKKFLTELSGKQQVETIINEITGYSKAIVYSSDSPSLVTRETNWDTPNVSDLHEFNYYYQVCCNREYLSNLKESFDLVKKQPNFIYDEILDESFIWEINEPSQELILDLIKNSSNAVCIKSTPALNNSPFANKSCPASKLSFLPTIVNETKQVLSYNTTENQFIKFVFQHIESLSKRVVNQLPKSRLISYRSKNLLEETKDILSDPFFDQVDNLNNIPLYSSVLQFRLGYKEIFEHYNKSKFFFSPLFHEQLGDLTSELKDIATLYEIWCFYYLAHLVLGNDILKSTLDLTVENGEVIYEAILENDTFIVCYNKSFTRVNKESYSLTLRPDITIIHKETGNICVFDAKYRIDTSSNDGVKGSSKYKAADIHKMHTYVDAITNCQSAVVMYVGNTFSFFQKGKYDKRIKSTSIDFDFIGVGAIPAIPGNTNSELQMIISKYFSSNMPGNDT
jgi:hypothetical protein